MTSAQASVEASRARLKKAQDALDVDLAALDKLQKDAAAARRAISELSKEQAEYINVKQEGPFKGDTYRY